MKKMVSIVLCLVLVAAVMAGCTPAVETPASEAPASEAPASEAPASEAPASEAPAAAGGSWKIAVVPKMTSIAWFERMENGVKMYNEQYGDDIFYGGSVEGADQAAYVETLLAEDWDAICVTPFDTEAMEPVFAVIAKYGGVVFASDSNTDVVLAVAAQYGIQEKDILFGTKCGLHFQEI